MAKRTSHLTKLDQISMGERKWEGKRKREKKRTKRGFSFSLDFPEILPSTFVRAKGKVRPRGENFE